MPRELEEAKLVECVRRLFASGQAKELRHHSRISLSEAASAIPCSVSQLCRWEAGPDAGTQPRRASALQAAPYLMGLVRSAALNVDVDPVTQLTPGDDRFVEVARRACADGSARELRRAMGLSLREQAELVGCSAQTLSRLERLETTPHGKTGASLGSITEAWQWHLERIGQGVSR